MKEKIIIKKDKEELLIFWIEERANFGFINCSQVLGEHALFSMSEASLDYFHSCKKASDSDIELALLSAKNVYRVECEARYKLSQKDTAFIWSKVA